MAKNKSIYDEVLDILGDDMLEITKEKVIPTYKEKFTEVAVDKWYNTYPKYYNSPYPRRYKRRYGQNGGLIDENTMEGMITYCNKGDINLTFETYSVTNPFYESEEENLVEFLAEKVSPKDRRVDLYEETENLLDSNNEIEEVICNSLKEKGYAIK